MGFPNEHLNEIFLFMDIANPRILGPHFRTISPECEWEVCFLKNYVKTHSSRKYIYNTKNDSRRSKPYIEYRPYKVKSMNEALKLLQGICTTTSGFGLDYIKKHYGKAVKLLIADIEKLKSNLFSEEKKYFGNYRLDNLIEALLLKCPSNVEQWILEEIDDFIVSKQPRINWASNVSSPKPYGKYLDSILQHSKKHKKLYKKIKKALISAYPDLQGQQITHVTYALLVNKIKDIDKLKDIISICNKNTDTFCLAILQYCNLDTRRWSIKQNTVKADLEKGLSIAKKPLLQKYFKKELFLIDGEREKVKDIDKEIKILKKNYQSAMQKRNIYVSILVLILGAAIIYPIWHYRDRVLIHKFFVVSDDKKLSK